MAMEPKILVLDEPGAGLTPKAATPSLSQIQQFHEQTGTTVILVSHSMEDIAHYANRVLVMTQGEVAMYDTAKRSSPARTSCCNWGFRFRRSPRCF